MLSVDIAILALQGFIFCFECVVLGLAAYVVHDWVRPLPYYEFNPNGEIVDTGRIVSNPAPPTFVFLLFQSTWSMLAVALLLATTIPKRTVPGGKLVGISKLSLTCLTFVFSLAGFAAYAASYRGWLGSDYMNALTAFTVLSWIAWLTLCILNVLTAMGIVTSELVGYHVLSIDKQPIEDAPASSE